eukprot:9567108-Heterocapsa_arctica.AAC.1
MACVARHHPAPAPGAHTGIHRTRTSAALAAAAPARGESPMPRHSSATRRPCRGGARCSSPGVRTCGKPW